MRSVALVLVIAACSPPTPVVGGTFAPPEVDGSGWHDTADPSPVIGRVHVEVHEERYALTGRTSEELSANLHERRPRDERFTGWTRWRLRWRFEPSKDRGRCHVGPVDVDLKITTVLPSWEPTEDADPRLVIAWNAYLTALEEHESGHAELAHAAAERIRDRLTDMASAGSCDRLRQRAHSVGHEEVQALRLLNAELDEHTGHGATQGAIFPGPDRLAAAN